jgi:beta-lactamase class D
VSRSRAAALVVLAAVLALAGCSPGGKGGVRLPFKVPGLGGPPFDTDKLEAAIDASFGGIGTCVVIDDTRTGAQLYRYNAPSACMRPWPPCDTFEVPSALVGLETGAVTPGSVLKWNGSPQPVTAWQHDADLKAAFHDSIRWWDQALAVKVGQDAYRDRLKAFGYGNASPDGPAGSFWLGPSQGGALMISTQDHARFLHRLYSDDLPVKADSAAYVQQLMLDETRGDFTLSGKSGTCASTGDGSRQVAWYVGRLKSSKSDYVFAASLESANDTSLPGEEIRHRTKVVFTQAGLWPPAP